MISEKVELLGKGLYKNIPDELTIHAMSTSTQLNYVGAEDFDGNMLDNILPSIIEEDINPRDLLEIDYQWICRCARFITFGPYFTTHTVYCSECGQVHNETRVDLRTIACKSLPEGFVNDIVLAKGDLIDYDGEIHLHLLTIQERINAHKDKLFTTPSGKINQEYARLCYMIHSIGKDKDSTPMAIKAFIEKHLSYPDYLTLVDKAMELTDYGLRAGGVCTCPRCGDEDAAYIALVDDRFFRPTVGDLKSGRDLRSARPAEKSA